MKCETCEISQDALCEVIADKEHRLVIAEANTLTLQLNNLQQFYRVLELLEDEAEFFIIER
jgi:hypothetical protein